MVRKDAGGVVSGVEIADLDGDGLTDLVVFAGARTGILGDEDATIAGQALEPGEAAVLICFENTWAAPFVTSVRRNGGNLLAFQRVPAQEVLDTVEALDAAEATSRSERKGNMPLLRGIARTAAIAGTATAVSNRVSRRQEGKWAAQEHSSTHSSSRWLRQLRRPRGKRTR